MCNVLSILSKPEIGGELPWSKGLVEQSLLLVIPDVDACSIGKKSRQWLDIKLDWRRSSERTQTVTFLLVPA